MPWLVVRPQFSEKMVLDIRKQRGTSVHDTTSQFVEDELLIELKSRLD